jgi:hypothetical protein
MESSLQNQKKGMAIPDAEYKHIASLLANAGRIGIYLKDKNGNTHRFFKQDGNIMCVVRDKDDNKEECEVFKMSDIVKQQEAMRQQSPFIQSIKNKLKEDYPDMSEDEIKANTDIIEHAGQTRQRLMKLGLTQEEADKIIMAALSEQHPYAQGAIQKEMIFGNSLKRGNREEDDNSGEK